MMGALLAALRLHAYTALAVITLSVCLCRT
jgi:hypothetical protein